MDHTLAWLTRKYKQAVKEQYEKSSSHIVEGYKSMLLVMDTLLNQGKEFENILPPSYETVIANQTKKEISEDKFVSGQWWIK
ncbi:hypothetical protein [Peribacillus frigoritolerans]|uniref:hypothetical protein n=1 Tax=Peribacillus frigoritolerans TaxID=450367 RepID=UPI00207965D4|nr:hypothetical protein [Peribacillus frigoritolerans]USK77914.1 hypothetical protein LIT31_26915 [Peribacillus frigoritolerans]